MIVALDGTVLTVAQPELRHDLHASLPQVQWTSTGYLIAVASLLVFAGRLGDRYGHPRVFAIGALGFGASSAGIALAPAIGWVIGLRIAQGVFGALLQPATLGMLRAAFPPDRLGMPIALRTSAIGLAAAAGPVLGGALVTGLGWRSVFLLNVVPAILLTALALALRDPAPRAADGSRLDLAGAGLLAVALVCLVHTLVAIPEDGWTATTALGCLGAAAAGGAFLRHERRTVHPLVPPGALGSPAAGFALGVLVCASAAMFGALFVGTYFLQDVLVLDPLRCGLQALPLAVMMVVGAPVSALLLRRYGARRTTVVAMALLALGILLLSRLDRSSGPAAIGVGFLAVGAGFGAVMTTATSVVVRGAATRDAGVAGGLQQTAMNIGPALGVALATALLTLTAPASPAGHPPSGSHRWSGTALLSAMGPTLTTLAATALLGVLLATRLPAPLPGAGRRPG
ncbi:MFS transporter [Streptomyces palmae]|uniref:MFS transporter n=1 Tax=Streptomyces palmae TaxID=1701085 RepID=A0A4Z0HCQ3_9ACTN|nr:MFS transporter [Streptomyces palmae]TGB14863.1 MFS transporter [Streptomyces palmae]